MAETLLGPVNVATPTVELDPLRGGAVLVWAEIVLGLFAADGALPSADPPEDDARPFARPAAPVESVEPEFT